MHVWELKSIIIPIYKIGDKTDCNKLTPRNRSTIDQIFSIRQILEKEWEYNGILHSILMNFGVLKKLVILIGMCLNGTKSRVRVGKQVSDIFEIHN
ncbi:hypothetical protein C0J52_24557, partial [Blattella germanica]